MTKTLPAKMKGKPTRHRGPFSFLVRSSLLFCLISICISKGSAINHQDYDSIHVYVEDMVNWLRINGGFMSDKVEIRRRVPGDRSSPSGIFAVSDIATEEVIFRVPSELYISVEQRDSQKGINMTHSDEEMAAYYHNQCRLATRLLDEIKLFRLSPSTSKFAPYIRYLEDLQSKGQIPATYSEQGKDVLRKIQGFVKNDLQQFRSAHFGESPLPPADLVDWIDKYFVQSGCIEANDADASHAVALVVQRGFDLELIPVWDMVNHDVRERVNIETNLVRSSGGLVVWAKRPISAGEEIFYSYNYCVDCDNAGEEWGTPGIFRDFGFLEGYPQEWPFLDQNVAVKIHQDEENRQRFYSTFLPQPAYETDNIDDEPGQVVEGKIDDKSHVFFQAQLSRLKGIDLKMDLAAVEPSHERQMIQSYFDSLVVALTSVIEQKTAASHDAQTGYDVCIG